MKEGVKKIFNGFLSLTLWSALTILVIRLFETLFLNYYTGGIGGHLLNNLLGTCFDLLYLALASLVLYVPYYLFSRKSEKKTLLVFRVLYSIVALISMFLLGYYAQAGIPLDRVFFMYSIKEILEIISSSQNTAWWMYLCIAFPPLFLFFITKKSLKINNITIFITIIAVLACAVIRIVFYDSTVNNRGYYEQSNKICYFLKSLGQDRQAVFNGCIPVEKVDEFHSYFPENEFVSYEYPFLSKEKNDDVIGQYFDLGEKKPNIVMIIVEGMGRENSGKYSKFISATPFLDSLADHSLYWLNCMSVSQRTAGVLPALLGALPFGREGFMAYRLNAPNFNSLPKILEENGYDFAFYHGGKAEFDNMNDFVTLNGGSQGFAERHTDSDRRNEWGLYDDYVFAETCKTIDFESDRPRLEVYLTLTSHAPWNYPNKENYTDAYLKMTDGEKNHYYDTPAVASYLYVDDAIRQLITDYSRKPGFENTIFIITGDHNFYLNNFVLEKYHVPLLIWSPMLTESRYFPAVVSHRDVTPTLISMLSEKYDIETPDEVAWINTALDTSSVFRSASFSPQMDASRNIVNMLYREYYVDNGNVYKINYDNNRLGLEPVNDKKHRIIPLYNLYKAMDKFVCDNNLLVESDDNNTSWTDIDEQFRRGDTLVSGLYPFKMLDIDLYENYKALKINYSMDLIFDKDDAANGISIGLITDIKDKNGNSVYYGCNDIRSFNKLVKHYEFNEVFKQSNYHYSDSCNLKIYLYNWNDIVFKISDISSTVKVAY